MSEIKKIKIKNVLKIRNPINIIESAKQPIDFKDDMTPEELEMFDKNLKNKIRDKEIIYKIQDRLTKKQLETQIKKENKIIEAKNKRGDYKKKDKAYHFISINPKETEIKEILHVIDKILKKSWFNVYCYVIEQRGEDATDRGTGKHIHIIADKTKSEFDTIHILYNTLKYLCSDKAKIDVKEMSEKGMKIRYNYIKGLKKEGKLKAQEQTIIWRTENHLKQLYTIREIRIKDGDIDDNDEELKKIEAEELKEDKYILTDTQIYKKENEEGYIYIKNENGEMVKYTLTPA
jgi:hypothetical protein